MDGSNEIEHSVKPYKVGGLSMSTRIVFESEGFRQILLSDGCKKLVQDTSEEICARANSQGNGEFGTDLIVGGYGGGRWIGFVSSQDIEAAKAEAENQTLTRSIK